MERDPLLTLEPVIEAVREALEGCGWRLSGLQKTTSHEFEGRWEGESSRSAYLFFHSDEVHEEVSIDVFLDETSKGLKGNLALVIPGPALGHLAPPEQVLSDLDGAARFHVVDGYRVPITLRLRLGDRRRDVERADSEIRVKLIIPRAAFDAGSAAMSALVSSTASDFTALLGDARVAGLLNRDD